MEKVENVWQLQIASYLNLMLRYWYFQMQPPSWHSAPLLQPGTSSLGGQSSVRARVKFFVPSLWRLVKKQPVCIAPLSAVSEPLGGSAVRARVHIKDGGGGNTIFGGMSQTWAWFAHLWYSEGHRGAQKKAGKERAGRCFSSGDRWLLLRFHQSVRKPTARRSEGTKFNPSAGTPGWCQLSQPCLRICICSICLAGPPEKQSSPSLTAPKQKRHELPLHPCPPHFTHVLPTP